MLNMLHAWWPGGVIIGGLLAYALGSMGAAWQIKLSLILIPAAIYLVMAIAQPYPKTERVTSNVSTGDMWRERSHQFPPIRLMSFVRILSGGLQVQYLLARQFRRTM